MSHHHTRRGFLAQLGLGCASVGATSLLSSITNLSLINAAAAANRSVYAPVIGKYKAIVCLMLSGGNDSFNMLVPKGDPEYQEYANVRTNLALDQDAIRTINPTNNVGKQLGLHPNLENIQTLFESGDAAFLANIGTLVEPTTVSQYVSGLVQVPEGLFSHSDQRLHWQTSVPQDRSANGWGGRLADILYTNNTNQNISMNISLDGINTFQRGNIITEYSVQPGGGAVNINGSNSNNFYNTLKRETLDSMLEASYQNILQKAYASTISDSKSNAIEFGAALAQGETFTTEFGTDALSQRFKSVVEVIASRVPLGVSNQTFFVQQGGYDNHDNNLEDHGALMANLDEAVGSFYDTLVELGLENDVVIFTASDFARKLVSNGDGSDHAWGGNSLIIGGAVNGKKIYGSYPDLYLGNNLDAGNGRILPTLSCDELFAELALWMGASSGDLNQILPNIDRFWTPTPAAGPLGILPIA
ncbi:MAG: hypothetical protein ACJA01_002078 [Saprospiraceae bacterium]|jgi:uncharacterized protein (DUF1501 family)